MVKFNLGTKFRKHFRKTSQYVNIYSIFTHKLNYIMNNIGSRIRKTRENKGFSQEAMALELDIIQSSYGRLEKDDNRLTVPKLQKIAEILEITISFLFDEKSAKIINQQHNENPQAYNVDTIIQADKEHIQTLKDEISFLRNLLSKTEI